MKTEGSEVLGIDVGGVIITRLDVVAGVSFLDSNYFEAKPVAGAFGAIDRLVHERFGPNVHLIVAADTITEHRTKSWLAIKGFYELASVHVDHLHFCPSRAEKTIICRQLGITHFIDDRMEVLARLVDVSTRILFSPHEDELKQYQNPTLPVSRVDTWKEITDMLLPPHSSTPSP